MYNVRPLKRAVNIKLNSIFTITNYCVYYCVGSTYFDAYTVLCKNVCLTLHGYELMNSIGKGPFINYVDKQGRMEGLAKCQRYYISLCNKLVNEGRVGQKSSKSSL